MTFTTPIIEIVNVVASATIDQKLDLNKIQEKFPDVEYHPDVFPGAVFRIRNPKSSTLLFSTGKMICTGSKSEELAEKAVAAVVKKLRTGGIKIKKDAIVTVQNIVSSVSLGGICAESGRALDRPCEMVARSAAEIQRSNPLDVRKRAVGQANTT